MKFFAIILCHILWCTTLFSQVPVNYYDSAAGKTCAALKSALKYIITKSHIPVPDDNLLAQYALTDVKPREVGMGSATVIWDVYADNPNGPDPYNYNPVGQNCGNYNSEADCYNKEHTVPKSWSDDDVIAEGDYHHVVPSDGWVNSKRSNYPFGMLSGNADFISLNGSKLGNSGVTGITGKVFEPIDEFKGDMARSFFYFITRYQDEVKTKWADNTQVFAADSFPTVNINYLPLMLAWHQADPVSDKELIRNEGGFTYQGNRNPYIDHPEFVNAVWNGTCPGLGVLPINLLSFTAVLYQNLVNLDWYVANVSGIANFELQMSADGKKFIPTAIIPYNGSSKYHYSTNAREGVTYYRIAWKESTGDYKFSSVIPIAFSRNLHWRIFPNPVTHKALIETPVSENEMVIISIFSVQGQKLYQLQTRVMHGKIFLTDLNLTPGVYYVKCRYQGSDIVLKMFVS